MTTAETASTDEREATAQGWVVRLASREIGNAELAAFEKWLAASDANRAAFDRARAVWLNLARVENLLPEPSAPRLSKPRRGMSVALAAGVAVFAICVFLIFDPMTRLRADALTAAGEVRKVSLPDGSVAVLDTDSAIDVAYTTSERRIRLLHGAAWFDVRPNPKVPFVVAADELRAVAKGTAYGVSRLHDGVRVEVTKGRVEVSVKDESATLVAGDTLTVSAGKVARRKSSENPLAWRDGRIVMEDATLREAVAELDRYRPGRVVTLGSIPDVHVNLSLDIAEQDRGLTSLAQTQALMRFDLTPWLTVLIPR
ncbi:MAG: FecR domain-containing protein [Gammaproteobacteria bacterium]